MSKTIFYGIGQLAQAVNVFKYSCGIPGNSKSIRYPGMTNYCSDGCPIITAKKVGKMNHEYRIGQMFGYEVKNTHQVYKMYQLKKVVLAYLNGDKNWPDMLENPYKY